MDVLPPELLMTCQVFGFLPVKYKPDLLPGIDFSLTAFLWGLALLIVHTTTCSFALCFDYLRKLEGRPVRMVSNTDTVAVFLDVATLVVQGVIFIISTTKNYQHLSEVYCSLHRFDSLIQHKSFKINIKPKIFSIYILLTILLILTNYFYCRLINNFIIYSPLYIAYYLQSAQFIHFTFTCRVISERFLVINDKIKQEVIRQSFGQFLKDLDYDSTLSGKVTASAAAGRVAKVRSLTDLYWVLCEAVHQADAFYTSQLFVIVITAFVHITMTLYYFFSLMWPSIGSEKVPHLIMRLLWVVAHSSFLILILFASTAVTNAADGAAPMVCKLINRKLDSELRRFLEVFLIQLKHHNVRFSALGFFNVHSHILTSLAGSVTTYLVILIQFQTQAQFNNPQAHGPICNCTFNLISKTIQESPS